MVYLAGMELFELLNLIHNKMVQWPEWLKWTCDPSNWAQLKFWRLHYNYKSTQFIDSSGSFNNIKLYKVFLRSDPLDVVFTGRTEWTRFLRGTEVFQSVSAISNGSDLRNPFVSYTSLLFQLTSRFEFYQKE